MSITFPTALPMITIGKSGQARKPEIIIGQRLVAAEIKEIPVESAPIAVEFRDRPHVRATEAGQFFRRLVNRPNDNDRHWLNGDFKSDARDKHPLLQHMGFYSELSEMLNFHGNDRLTVLRGPGGFERERPLRDLDQETIRDRDDNVAKQIARFEGYLSTVYVIGDGLYEQCEEPHLAVQAGHAWQYPDVCAQPNFRQTINKAVQMSYFTIFPVTCFEEACATAEKLTSGKKVSRPPVPLVTVREPAMFSVSFPAENAAILGRHLLDSFETRMKSSAGRSLPRLVAAGETSVQHLFTLSDAVENYRPGNEASRRLTAKVQEFLDLPPNAPIWSLVDRSESILEMMDYVQNCLDDAPVDLELVC